MPQYRGTPGPRSGSEWVGEWVGKHVGDFWDSIGSVNEINTPPKKKEQSYETSHLNPSLGSGITSCILGYI